MLAIYIILSIVLLLVIVLVVKYKPKPLKFIEHFDMESHCNHCCINNDTKDNNLDCSKNCYYNGVVCDCCKKYDR
jgi:hypothetical protein